uniref:Beta-Casp domain-containing protein n=1 Tax=Ditylenchus dipsaci TaxID=166011 RepID=A0A915CYU3_9BILA
MLTSLARQPDSSPSSMASKFTSTVADTLKKQGNVLIPISPTGVIYDLIELVINTIERHSLSRDIPIYFISVVAESTFAFANIYSEWLSQVKSEKAYVPEDPFPLVELVKSGRIKIYENLHGAFSRECRTPCVVFTGHPSLRIGDVVHFLEIWGKDPRSAVIMTDPDFPLDPFYDPHPFGLQSGLLKHIARFDSKCLMMHESYARPLIYPDNKKLVISHPNLITFGANRTKLSLPYNQRRKRVIIESELLSEMKLQCCGENSEIGMSSLGAMLSAYDNDLKILPPMGSKRPKLLIDQRLGGKVAPGRLIKALADRRIKADLLHSKSFESSSSVLIKIPVFNAEVKINDQDHKAKIFCPTPAHREIIQAAIKECLADV